MYVNVGSHGTEGVLAPLETWCGCWDLSSVLHRSSKCQLVIHFSSLLPHIRILKDFLKSSSGKIIITSEKGAGLFLLMQLEWEPIKHAECQVELERGDSHQPICRSCAQKWPLDYLFECWCHLWRASHWTGKRWKVEQEGLSRRASGHMSWGKWFPAWRFLRIS